MTDYDQRAVQASWQLRTWARYLLLAVRDHDWPGARLALRRLRRNMREVSRG